LILGLLWVDFAVHRKDHAVTLRKALVVSGAWVAVSVAFGVAIGAFRGWESAGEYYGVYLTEKSLSIDNIFVLAVLLRAFAVPAVYQRRVLFYGVFGALAFRAALIAVGATLVDEFGWILYGLGGLLIVSGIRMARGSELIDPDRNKAIRLLRRVVPVTPDFVGQSFVTRVNGVRIATPLLLALLTIEMTDLVFAMDSIPAAFGISGEVFVIFTANAFAVLGLRSLYFVLVGALNRFTYVNFGLAALLVFIGCKMLLEPFATIPILVSVTVIIAVVAASIGASFWHERHAASVPDARAKRVDVAS
jgi:tellurite resistance protein TerC